MPFDFNKNLALDIALPDHDLVLDHDATPGEMDKKTDFIQMEKNLASLGFFSPSSKTNKAPKAKTIKFIRLVEGRRVEASVSIAPSVLSTLPTTADQDKYLAFQKILLDRRKNGILIANPIAFTSAELLRVLGDKLASGKNYRDIERWLDVMTSTTIISKGSVYFSGGKQWASDTFHVFDRAISVGKVMADGSTADKNYVWLSEWQLQNLNNNYLLPIDFEAYKALRNHIAKALVPLLQIWLFASEGSRAFEKRYGELCQHLSIAKYRYLSKIREKLAPALDELVERGYLTGWDISATADKSDYKVIFRHGAKYFEDKSVRNPEMPVFEPRRPLGKPLGRQMTSRTPRQKRRGSGPPEAFSRPADAPAPAGGPAPPEKSALEQQAEEVCRFFHQRLYQTGEQAILLPVELKEAMTMIQQHGIERTKGVIEYFAGELAPKTHYRPATLCGLRPHVAVAIQRLSGGDSQGQPASKQADPITAQERARARHRKNFQDAYDDFRVRKLEELRKSQPRAYQEFLARDAAVREEQGKDQCADIRAITLRHFDREERRRDRAWEYFSEKRPDCGTLTFWEWDASENPHSLGAENAG